MHREEHDMKALILIDIQNDYFPGGKFSLKGMNKAAKKARAILDAFRKSGDLLVHIRHINIRSGATFFLPDTDGSNIHDLVAPRSGETVLIKHYPNSFRETGLDELLKRQGINELHIAGAMTNVCVDTTTRAAFDLGYTIKLHQNACAARPLFGTGLVHLVSIKTLGSVFAELV
jgi:nicotinamidase-related amidase